MNTLDMVREYLKTHGFAGLASDNCGCGLGDLAPCGDGLSQDCHAAQVRVLGPDEYVGDCGPGDMCYFRAS